MLKNLVFLAVLSAFTLSVGVQVRSVKKDTTVCTADTEWIDDAADPDFDIWSSLDFSFVSPDFFSWNTVTISFASTVFRFREVCSFEAVPKFILYRSLKIG